MDTSERDREVYAFGPFRLDPVGRALSRDSAPVALSPTAFDLLLHLVENPGRVVSKDELLDTVWRGKTVEESNITQTVFVLRKALSGGGSEPPLIVTAPGRGYRFTEPVRMEAWKSEPPSSEIAGRQAPSARPARIAAAFALVALLAGLVAGAWIWRQGQAIPGRNVVVLSEFLNSTGEPIFDRALGTVLEIDLVQSPFLTIMPDQRVADTLVLMTRPKDAPLTPELAQEVCVRNNGKVVVGGSIARLGSKYLLTLTASDCAGDRIVAAEKTEVADRDALIPALDRLAGQMRRSLGESIGSIRKFDIPLEQQRTISLEALKAYSEGIYFLHHGKRWESISLFERSVELDPRFAMAYAQLSSLYEMQYDNSRDIANIAKAYALRDTVSERDRLFITARYHQSVTHDINEAIRDYQIWTEVYPMDQKPWGNLANLQSSIGQYRQAIEPAKQGLKLGPDLEANYVILADAYMRTGQTDKARAICTQAIAKGLAGDGTRRHLFEIAYMQSDQGLMKQQIDWAKGKPSERLMTLLSAITTLSKGRLQSADVLFDRVNALGRQQGQSDFFAVTRARYLVELGLTDQARLLLDQATDKSDPGDYLFTQAEIGDPARVATMLKDDLGKGPADTLLIAVYAPEVRAALALRAGKPKEAIVALQPAIPYDLIDFDAPYLLGSAYLADGDGAHAAPEFRRILDHQGVYPVDPLFVLARLGLARADRLAGNLSASRREYEAFFAAWKGADANLPILEAARVEYAKL